MELLGSAGELESPLDGAEDYFDLSNEGNEQDNEFDAIVGVLEEVIMDDSFISMQAEFMTTWCGTFDDAEENKLEYMDVFRNYHDLIEGHLETKLKARIPTFDMERFFKMVSDREDEISSDIFDILMSLGEFSEFKDLMLSHKKRQGPQGARLDSMEVVGHHDPADPGLHVAVPPLDSPIQHLGPPSTVSPNPLSPMGTSVDSFVSS